MRCEIAYKVDAETITCDALGGCLRRVPAQAACGAKADLDEPPHYPSKEGSPEVDEPTRATDTAPGRRVRSMRRHYLSRGRLLASQMSPA